jgi:hypothetical protein
MSSVNANIRYADRAICDNIESYSGDRALLARNLLSQLRNLVESIAVRLHTKDGDAEYNWNAIKPAVAFVKGNAKLNVLGRFHKLLEGSASHYTLDSDSSERLMLKYYELLHRVRSLVRDRIGLEILANLDDFPVDLDPSLSEYHEKIAARIEVVRTSPTQMGLRSRYYIKKVRPFFTGGRIFYEVTFTHPVDRVSKFDRIIAFTDIDMTDKYAANLTLQRDSIEVLGQTMPITIIEAWEVSVRPCEFDNFAELLGQSTEVTSSQSEYRRLMEYLTTTSANLLEITDMPDAEYVSLRAWATAKAKKPQIFPVLDSARNVIRGGARGTNVLRYLLLTMDNWQIKQQRSWDTCSRLSRLNLLYGCIPFEEMPFCTSLPGHNPRFRDLAESLDMGGREHELLARRVKNNVERHGVIYTPVADLEDLGPVDELMKRYNDALYFKHKHRELVKDRGHVFIRGYEDDTVTIIKELQARTDAGVLGYSEAVGRWLGETSLRIDDDAKASALRDLFGKSRVAAIYGAAGTGKSTMVNYIASYFSDKTKLFLAQTHPAVENLKRRVEAQQHSDFRTLASHLARTRRDPEYDVLVIDECSTVSNADLIRVLSKTSFKLLVLVGDIYQIEAIDFGNWFGVMRSFIPPESVFELTTPYRTKNQALLGLWGKVRSLNDDIAEAIARSGYSAVLDQSLFEAQRKDEIVLCLNYDGLYGINNVNRFLQSSNPGKAVAWGVSTYKVGDPVLFSDTDRFRGVIHNNLKGNIVGIAQFPDRVQFEIELDRPITAFDVDGHDLRWMRDSVVEFNVYERASSDRDDDAADNTIVPFQVAYAVSIHKAQGLEYDSVKVVITDGNENAVTHSIFYTAITRARDRLRIFWTPETQQAVLERLERPSNRKDVRLLTERRDVVPVSR